MKKIILLIAFTLLFLQAFSQNWEWAKVYNYGVEDLPMGLGLDRLDNVYMLTNDYYYRTHSLMYLCKYDQNGNELWKFMVPSFLKHSVTDSLGNTYCAGGSQVIKYDSNGTVVWHDTLNAPIIGDICLNVNGEIQIISYGYMSGLAHGIIISLDPNGSTSWISIRDSVGSKLGTTDPFGNLFVVSDQGLDTATGNMCDLVKIDSLGNLLWKVVIPHIPLDVVSDQTGNVYVAGRFSQPGISINGNYYSCPYGSGNPNSYLLKFDGSGNLLWYKMMKNVYPKLKTNSEGHLYLIGSGGVVHIDSLQFNETSSFSYIIKLNESGNILWHTVTSTVHGNGGASPRCVLLNRQEDLIMAGILINDHYFGNIVTSGNYSYSQNNYIAKYSFTASPTGISNDLENNHNLSVFPNPSHDALELCYSGADNTKEVKISICSIDGKLLIEERHTGNNKIFRQTMDISSLSPGMYMVQLEEEGIRIVKKFVKQ